MIALTETTGTTVTTGGGTPGKRSKVDRRHVVDRAENIPPGARRIVEIEGRSVGVLNVDGTFHALINKCPHHGAPLCEGVVRGTMEDSAVHEYSYGRHNKFVICPWHGYEFMLDTGLPRVDLGRMRVRVYEVAVEDGDVVVYA